MIAVYILAGILILIALMLFLPVSVYLQFKEDFFFKIKFAGIKVYEPKSESEIVKEATEVKKKEDSQLKTTFQKLKEKRGFIGAVKEIFLFFKSCLDPFKYLLKTIKFKNVCLDLSVTGEDAAQTAIRYGQACSLVYPTVSFFQSKANVKLKQINVKSEFEQKNSSFSFSMVVSLRIISLIISIFKVYKEYKNFVTRNDL